MRAFAPDASDTLSAASSDFWPRSRHRRFYAGRALIALPGHHFLSRYEDERPPPSSRTRGTPGEQTVLSLIWKPISPTRALRTRKIAPTLRASSSGPILPGTSSSIGTSDFARTSSSLQALGSTHTATSCDWKNPARRVCGTWGTLAGKFQLPGTGTPPAWHCAGTWSIRRCGVFTYSALPVRHAPNARSKTAATAAHMPQLNTRSPFHQWRAAPAESVLTSTAAGPVPAHPATVSTPAAHVKTKDMPPHPAPAPPASGGSALQIATRRLRSPLRKSKPTSTPLNTVRFHTLLPSSELCWTRCAWKPVSQTTNRRTSASSPASSSASRHAAPRPRNANSITSWGNSPLRRASSYQAEHLHGAYGISTRGLAAPSPISVSLWQAFQQLAPSAQQAPDTVIRLPLLDWCRRSPTWQPWQSPRQHGARTPLAKGNLRKSVRCRDGRPCQLQTQCPAASQHTSHNRFNHRQFMSTWPQYATCISKPDSEIQR